MQKITKPQHPVLTEAAAHMVYDADGELNRVTLNDSDAEMADLEGCDVTFNATAEEISRRVAPMPATDYMDSKTWATVAPALKALSDVYCDLPNPYDRQPPDMPLTPPDLPQNLLEDRYQCLTRIYDERFDLGAYVEIQELLLARQENRAANQSLFVPGSWESNWEDIYQEDLELLDQRAEGMAEMIAEHASEKAAFGDGPVGSFRKDMLAKMEMQEIDYAIKTWFAEDEQPDQVHQDIPY
jgi:hypothetical protein